MKTKPGPSERKRVGQPSSGRNATKPLKGRSIFLHVQGYRGAAKLEQDVTLLGGTVEKCFSRDVNCVVTNRGSPSDYEKKKKPSSVSCPSPVTPSPFNLATPGVDSPQGHSPGSLEIQKPLTRGKAMMQAAKSTKSYGTMDVIEMARSWKLKIIHIDNALRWIKKEISKIPDTLKNNREDASKRQMKVRKLRGPYMKFEASTRSYKPLYQEFTSLPDVGFDTAHWTCPFLKGKQSNRIDERGEGEEERDPQQGAPDDLMEERDASPGPSQKKEPAAKKTKDDPTDDLFGSPILTAGEIRNMLQERKKAELKRGYCEICTQKYDNIDKHTSNSQHREFVRNNKNYAQLDQMITEGPNMKQFVAYEVKKHNILNADDDMRERCTDEVLLLTEPSAATPRRGPMLDYHQKTTQPKHKANTKGRPTTKPSTPRKTTPPKKKTLRTPNKSESKNNPSVRSPRHKVKKVEKTDMVKPTPEQITPSKSKTRRGLAHDMKTPTKLQSKGIDTVRSPRRVTRASPQVSTGKEMVDNGKTIQAESPVSSRATRRTNRPEPVVVEPGERPVATASHETATPAEASKNTLPCPQENEKSVSIGNGESTCDREDNREGLHTRRRSTRSAKEVLELGSTKEASESEPAAVSVKSSRTPGKSRTDSDTKAPKNSADQAESSPRRRQTRRSLQPATGNAPESVDGQAKSKREDEDQNIQQSTQDSANNILLKRLGISAIETQSTETKTRRNQVSSPDRKTKLVQNSSVASATKEKTKNSAAETGEMYLLKRLGISATESPTVGTKIRRNQVLSPECNPVSIKAVKDEITPRTARTIKCLLKKQGTPRVMCPRLDMDEINKSQNSLTTADSVFHTTSQSDLQSQPECGPVEEELGPVRKVRSSRRSHASSVPAVQSVESKPISADIEVTLPSRLRGHSVERHQDGKVGKTEKAVKISQNDVCHDVSVDNVRQTRKRTCSISNTQSPLKEQRAPSKKEQGNEATSVKETISKEQSIGRKIKREPKGIRTPEKAKTSTPAQPSSRRRVRLKQNWSIATERSMQKILQLESDGDFEGFSQDSVDTKDLPSDTSYEDVSEVEVEENSETEWVISGNSHSTVGSPTAVISTGLDCDNSSPTKSATGVTPIKHVLGNISNIMSEASSTGWDDNLDDFLEGQLKRKAAKDEANASGLFTSLLVQVGSPRRSPRKSPGKSNVKSPFKFVESPLAKVKTPGQTVPVRSSPRHRTPGQNTSLRNSPKSHTPQTANRTLDFNTPNFSLLDTLGEVEDLWVGPTKCEQLSRSYTQKAADRLSQTPVPPARTPIYQQQGSRVTQSTPVLSAPSTSKQSSISTLSPFSQSSVGERKGIVFGKSPKTANVYSPPGMSKTPTGPSAKSKISSETSRKNSQVAKSPITERVDEEVEFNFSSPSKRVKETLKKMIIPSPITPIENKEKPKKRLLGRMSETEATSKKRPTSDSYDFDEPDEIEIPKKKLLKSVSNTKKQFTLSFMPAVEFKAGSSLKHKTTSSPSEPKVKPTSRTPDVVLSNLGRSVTPRTESSNSTTPVSTKPQQPAAAVKHISRTPHRKPAPSPSQQKNTQTTTTTPRHSEKLKRCTDKAGASPEPSSTQSTPRTMSPGRRLDKLLALHSLEDIQFGPRRKSSNVASIVRFHYDPDEEDCETSESENTRTASESRKVQTPSSGAAGGRKSGSRSATPKRCIALLQSASTKPHLSSGSTKRSVSSHRSPKAKRKVNSPKVTNKLRSPGSDKWGKSPDWSKAKPGSGRRSESRLHYTKWPKTKYTDWSKSHIHSRSKSAVELAKRRSLRSEKSNKKSHSVVLPENRRHSSPRKRLRMDPSPCMKLSRTRSFSSTIQAKENEKRSNLRRSAKRGVSYVDVGSEGIH